MTNRHIYKVLMVLMFTACKNGTQKVETQQLESDSSAVVVSDHPITDRLYAELDSSEVYNDSIIEKSKKGKFAFDGKVITLESDEGWNDYFNGVMYYKHNGTNFYLTDKEEGLYLLKGSD